MENDGDIIGTIVDRLLTFQCRLLQYFLKNIRFVCSQLCHLLDLHTSQDVQSFIRHVSLIADLSSVEVLIHDLEVYLATPTESPSQHGDNPLTLNSVETLLPVPRSPLSSPLGFEQKALDYIAFSEQFKQVIATCKLAFALFDSKKLKILSRNSSEVSAQHTTSHNTSSMESDAINLPSGPSSSYNYDDFEIHCIKRLLRSLGPLEVYNQIDVRRSFTSSPSVNVGASVLSSSISSSSTFNSSGSFGSDLDVLVTLVDLLNVSFSNYNIIIEKLVDNDHLLYQGFRLFFPKGQFLNISSLFYLLIPYLQQPDKQDVHSLSVILTKFEEVLPPYFDIEFPQAANEQLIYDIVINYTRLFSPQTKAF